MWASSAHFGVHISRCAFHQRVLAVTFQDVRFISAFLWPHFKMWGSSACFDAHISRCALRQRIFVATF
jgi:hypothetical protein